MKPQWKLLAAPLLCLSLATTAWAVGDDVAATVNGKEIRQIDIDNYITDLKLNPEQAQHRDQILNNLIARELVYQDAIKQGLDKKPDVVAAINQARTNILSSAAVREAVLANPVTEDEMKAEYTKQLPNMQLPEFKTRHILVKTEAEAKEIIKALNKGQDFAKLAKEKSIDPSGKKGGELDWFSPRDMIPPPFTKAVSELKKGSYTKEPVKTQYGWHVIKLDDTRTAKAPDYEAVKQQLHNLVQQRHIAEYVDKLKAAAKIDVKKP